MNNGCFDSSRWRWLFFLLVFTGAGLPQLAYAGGTEKPNILLIVLDDFGFNDLAINNDSDSPTENLDALARNGVRFVRHYAESTCAPSRAALLTGRYAATLGYHPYRPGLSAAVETLPELLAAEGYLTAAIGKWHVGEQFPEARPRGQGFARWFGFTNQMYLAGPHEGYTYKPAHPTYINPWLEENDDAPRQYEGHLTDLITERAVNFIRTEKRAWFLYLSYYAPHGPIQPAERFSARFPNTAAGRYQALKAQLDDSIGQVFTALRTSGQYDNTLAIVVSDNGGTARSYPSNLPYSGGKSSYLEGGIRTPLLAHWPGHWRAGQVLDHPVMIADVLPTVLEALSLPVPVEVNGRSLFSRSRDRTMRWYSHYGVTDSHGLMTDGGKWYFSSWMGSPNLQHHSKAGSGAAANVAVSHPGQLALMTADAEAWSRKITRVSPAAGVNGEGWLEISEDEFRRSPISGTWSFGVPVFIPRDVQTTGVKQQSLLIAQEGFFAMHIDGRRLRLMLDSHETAVDLPEKPSACSTVVVTASLTKSHQVFYRVGAESVMRVYLDGVRILEEKFVNPALNENPVTTPLVFYPARQETPGIVGERPFISTRMIQDKEVSSSVHAELFAACEDFRDAV